jgi:phenylalanyl-tRNA synthetase beta chain
LNPLSRDLEVMRQTLLFSGLESLAYNLNRKQKDLKFYEFGNVYLKNPEYAASPDVTKKYSESKILSIFVTGAQENESWYSPENMVDHHFLKYIILSVLRKAGIPFWKMIASEFDKRIYSSAEAFHLDNRMLLTLGKLNTSILGAFDIRQEVFYAEINWQVLIDWINPERVKFMDVPRFPEVRRDLALILDRNVKFAELEELAYKTGKGLLKAVNLFDVYEGDKIGPGKKSYALSFMLQDEMKTLTDVDVDKLMNKLAEVFEKEFSAHVRK